MNDYEPSAPRAALALAAVAMTTITMGALVVLPAKFDSMDVDASSLASAKAATEAPFEVTASPEGVDGPAEDREVLAHAGRATLGVQASGGGSHPLRSRTRATF